MIVTVSMFIFIMKIMLVLSLFGLFWTWFVIPFRKEESAEPYIRPPQGLASRIQQNTIRIPDHRPPEPAEVKRIHRLKPGTTKITDPAELKRLELKAMEAIKNKNGAKQCG